MTADTNSALLRRFEPVIRYTRGEQFFPMDVRPYVGASSLWVQQPNQEPECLVPEGELTLEKLAQSRADGSDAIYFLKFIEPLNIAQLAAYQLQEHVKQGLIHRDSHDAFRAGRGRLARVGYASRLVDALFSLTLLARGRVPGDTAAAAILEYERLLDNSTQYCYYGRVLRRDDWIVLQYWFFYPFNNWRSGFFGVNDHEADWEMICIYCYQPDAGEVQPAWVAYASHDFAGDDLRRRWDDPELEKVGQHPVIYAGAGSHASYYAPGEYLPELELSFLSPVARLTERWGKTLRQTWSQGQDAHEPPTHQSEFNIFRIPFVDYARGDGLSIGPGQDQEWGDPRLLNPVPAWALNYRGLWGLYARDPISGENAPAGPLYNRDGTIRRAWYDPLGWAGLDKVPPPHRVPAHLRKQQETLASRRAELVETIAQKSQLLVGLGVEAAAMQDYPHLHQQHVAHQEKIAALSAEIDHLRAHVASEAALSEAIALYNARIEAGESGPPRAHIRRAHCPASDDELRLSRWAEVWAALSIGLMMVGFVGLALFARQHLISGLVALVSLIVFIESGFRGQLSRLIASVTIGLAVVAALVLLFEFFWLIVVLTVLTAGGYIIWENLRELL
ncbi:MAG TPA: hypothetical protein ENN99_15830 [Chloroflexi bacterium]|nr:hypothetical protein [Chloroflexota bacterium]